MSEKYYHIMPEFVFKNRIYTLDDVSRSPLLTTMLNTEIPLDMDSYGRIILDDLLSSFTVKDVDLYMEFCRTGLIDFEASFVLGKALFDYMGHTIAQPSNTVYSDFYNKIRIMEMNNGGVISKPTTVDLKRFVTDVVSDLNVHISITSDSGYSGAIVVNLVHIVVTDDITQELLVNRIRKLKEEGKALHRRWSWDAIASFTYDNHYIYEVKRVSHIRDYILTTKSLVHDIQQHITYESIMNYIYYGFYSDGVYDEFVSVEYIHGPDYEWSRVGGNNVARYVFTLKKDMDDIHLLPVSQAFYRTKEEDTMYIKPINKEMDVKFSVDKEYFKRHIVNYFYENPTIKKIVCKVYNG